MSTTQPTTKTQLNREGTTLEKVVTTRGRVYIHEAERQQLGIRIPYGTRLYVSIEKPDGYDNESHWSMWFSAEGYVELGEYGEFTIPKHIREELSIEQGDQINVYTKVA